MTLGCQMLKCSISREVTCWSAVGVSKLNGCHNCPSIPLYPSVRKLSPFIRFICFPNQFRVHIWQVSPQLGCPNIVKMWCHSFTTAGIHAPDRKNLTKGTSTTPNSDQSKNIGHRITILIYIFIPFWTFQHLVYMKNVYYGIYIIIRQASFTPITNHSK